MVKPVVVHSSQGQSHQMVSQKHNCIHVLVVLSIAKYCFPVDNLGVALALIVLLHDEKRYSATTALSWNLIILHQIIRFQILFNK